MNEIFKLRIIKSSVRSFPFDLLYLVGEAQKALLPKLFPWSLCLVMTDDLKQRIGNLNVHVEEVCGHHTPRERTTMNRSGRKLEGVLPWEQCTFIVIPILPLTRRGLRKSEKPGLEKHRYTPYLMAPQHSGKSATTTAKPDEVLKPAIENILDDDTVLFTPSGPVRPICHKCPRALFHIQGLCQLGNATCFEELTLWAPDTSATEGSDVELQEDHADATGSPANDPA
jgi:hypothetical protein